MIKRTSKHAAKSFDGKVKIGQHSGLRKLMRAARRGLIPDERMVIIQSAIDNVEARKC